MYDTAKARFHIASFLVKEFLRKPLGNRRLIKGNRLNRMTEHEMLWLQNDVHKLFATMKESAWDALYRAEAAQGLTLPSTPSNS